MSSPTRNYLSGMLAEFTRAIAAAHRYEQLRYGGAGHRRIAPEDVPSRIFEEFYSVEEAVQVRRPAWRRSDSTQDHSRPARASS